MLKKKFSGVLLTVLALSMLASKAFASPYDNRGGPLLAAASPPVTCQKFLGNNLYSCNLKSSFGTSFHDCFQFTSPGTISSNFDLHVAGLGGNGLGCSCKAKGSLKKPQFDVSHAFDCVSAAGDTSGSDGFTFQGQATSTKIKLGFVASGVGNTFVYECVLDPTCTP